MDLTSHIKCIIGFPVRPAENSKDIKKSKQICIKVRNAKDM